MKLRKTHLLKKTALAEIRAMRALNYFMAMDVYGDVPLVTTFGASTQPGPRVSRSTISDFIETELKAALPDLSATTGSYDLRSPDQMDGLCTFSQIVHQCTNL